MALREILEHDTSAHTQAAQSAANQAQDRKECEAKMMETGGESTTVDERGDKTVVEPVKEAEDVKSEVETVKEVEQPRTPVIAEKDTEEKMEVAEAEANIPPVNAAQEMEMETIEISDTLNKTDDNA